MVEVTSESYENPADHQYTVSIDGVTGELMACTCPHHVHRDAFCKHMAAVENATDDGHSTYSPPRPTKTTSNQRTVTASVTSPAGSASARVTRNCQPNLVSPLLSCHSYLNTSESAKGHTSSL
jgi:hypothetical protein